MIILDTNVVSEPLKPKPATVVLEWLDRQAPETLYITTISLAELQAGVEALPMGRRRTALQQATTELVAGFEGRVLSFDQDSARVWERGCGHASSGQSYSLCRWRDRSDRGHAWVHAGDPQCTGLQGCRDRTS